MEVKIERAASLETNDAALKRIATFLLQYGAEKGTIKISEKSAKEQSA